jgi:signal peptidase II
MPSAAERRLFWLPLVVTVAIDRITKVIAEASLVGRPVEIIGDAVQFHLVYNRGAAFGMGQAFGGAARWIFSFIAIGAVILLWRMSREARPGDLLRQWSLGFVAGGAAGNLIDRLLSSRGVVDFIDVGVGSLRWPTFNVADIAVSCGAVALALSLWREDVRRRAESPTT